MQTLPTVTEFLESVKLTVEMEGLCRPFSMISILKSKTVLICHRLHSQVCSYGLLIYHIASNFFSARSENIQSYISIFTEGTRKTMINSKLKLRFKILQMKEATTTINRTFHFQVNHLHSSRHSSFSHCTDNNEQ